MTTNERQLIASLADHRGYALMVDAFKKERRDLELLLAKDGNSVEDDRRLLLRWKSLISFIETLETRPQKLQAELLQKAEEAEGLGEIPGMLPNVSHQ